MVLQFLQGQAPGKPDIKIQRMMHVSTNRDTTHKNISDILPFWSAFLSLYEQKSASNWTAWSQSVSVSTRGRNYAHAQKWPITTPYPATIIHPSVLQMVPVQHHEHTEVVQVMSNDVIKL